MGRPSHPAASKRSEPPNSDRRRSLLISAGLAAAIALVYAPVRHYGFVPLDDPHYITDNLHVTGGLTWANVAWAFTTGYAANWHPLTWLSFMTDVHVFGLRPDMQHVINVLLHAASTLLLFGWLRRTTGAVWPSAFVAAIFAVHPLHVESVAWITERKDVLSTFFWMLTLWAYTAYVRRPGVNRYLLALLCFACGLMAKPMLVTLPFVLLLLDVWPLARVVPGSRASGGTWRRLVVEKAPFLVLSAASSVVTFLVQQRGGAMITSQIFAFGLRAQNAIVASVRYLWQAVWPVDLIVWYAYPEAIPAWQVASALAVLAAISIAAVRLRARPYLGVGWFWYLGTLVPVSGLVQVGLQPRADRYTYIPLIGITIMVAWGASALGARSKNARVILAAAGVAVIASLAVLARQQVGYWQDGVTLWGHASDVTPGVGGAQAQFGLGRALSDAGRLDTAEAHLRHAVELKPDWGAAHGQLGSVLLKAGRKSEARSEYETALRLEPDQAEVQNNYGAMLGEQGQLADALPHFAAAARLEPDYESAQANLGVALMRLGRKAEAMQAFQNVLRINPRNAMARQLLDALGK